MSAAAGLLSVVQAQLAGDAALQAAGVTVHDIVPAGAQPPYIVLGPIVSSDASLKDRRAREHRLSLSLWLRDAGTDDIGSLSARIETLVEGLSAPLPGHWLGRVSLIRSTLRREPVSGLVQWLAEYRLRTFEHQEGF